MAKIEVTPETLQALIASAVAEALKAQAPATNVHKLDGKSERSIKNQIAATKAFQRLGFKDAKPGENIKTYNRWIAEGRKVKVGEHAVKVRNLRLFHISQTEALDADAKAAEVAKMQEAIRKYNDKKSAAKAGTAQSPPPNWG